MSVNRFCLAVLLLVCTSQAAPVADLVSGADLPGWNKELASDWYSGFLEVDAKKLHYMLVESEGNPKTDPVVLWLNGGPGCSSLEGFLYEHGPLVVGDAHNPPNINFDGKPSPANLTQLVRNPWAWSKAANVIYLEAPAGVGFSYSSNPADLNTGDNQTAADNLAALHAFFSKFPEFAKNDFYVSGESYGGVYVPTLSLKIYQDSTFPGSMKGYLVGNGVFDGEQSTPTHVPFAYGHGFISTKLYKKILATCPSDYHNPSTACEALLHEVDGFYHDTNGYDAYRTCYHPSSEQQSVDAQPGIEPTTPYSLKNLLELSKEGRHGRAGMIKWLKNLRESVPCINSVAGTAWTNLAATKKALHVTASPNTWAVCGGVNYTDDGVYSSMVALHKQMITNYKPRVMVYNGDVDPGCNYLWAEASVEAFGLAVTHDWHAWAYGDKTVGEQLGGFATNYEGDVTFATIHGAGHMSPQWRPEAAYTMLSSFLAQKSL